jgi:hypothetical protein
LRQRNADGMVNIAHIPKINSWLQCRMTPALCLGGGSAPGPSGGNVTIALAATFGVNRSHPVFQRCPVLLTFLNLPQVESASALGSPRPTSPRRPGMLSAAPKCWRGTTGRVMVDAAMKEAADRGAKCLALQRVLQRDTYLRRTSAGQLCCPLPTEIEGLGHAPAEHETARSG